MSHRERGSLSLFLAIVLAGLFAAIGVVVDAGGRLEATVNADELAAEAARAGAQEIDAGAVANGQGVRLAEDKATTAAKQYLRSQGQYSADVFFSNGDRTILVTFTTHYVPVMLTIVGIPSLKIDGAGSATVVAGR